MNLHPYDNLCHTPYAKWGHERTIRATGSASNRQTERFPDGGVATGLCRASRRVRFYARENGVATGARFLCACPAEDQDRQDAAGASSSPAFFRGTLPRGLRCGLTVGRSSRVNSLSDTGSGTSGLRSTRINDKSGCSLASSCRSSRTARLIISETVNPDRRRISFKRSSSGLSNLAGIGLPLLTKLHDEGVTLNELLLATHQTHATADQLGNWNPGRLTGLLQESKLIGFEASRDGITRRFVRHM